MPMPVSGDAKQFAKSEMTQQVRTNDHAASAVPFPFLDLREQFAEIRTEVLTAVTRVLESQHFILGSEVESLESEIARLVGCRFAIGCASGSDALLLALMALEIGPGDEVITTPFTFVATAGSIARLGARPVFVDIDPADFNVDSTQIRNAITERTKAILPVHLFGLAANMDSILDIARSTSLPIIEDAAQAIGAQFHGKGIGSLGAVGCFSFFPSKNLGGAGDGGMITTNDPDLADRLRVLRVHGSKKKYQCELLGINSRLDALQAAILQVKFRYLAKWTAARQRNADRYRALFEEFELNGKLTLPSADHHRAHVYNQFVIRTSRRDELRAYLQQRGIPTEIYYPYPLHLQSAFAYLGHHKGDFPEAEAACLEVLALPIYAELTDVQLRRVVAAIAGFFAH